MYPVTLRLIQTFFTEKVHGNLHESCNIETNIIKKMLLSKGSAEISKYLVTLRLTLLKNVFTGKGSMEISMYSITLSNSEIIYGKGPWKFSCIL